MPPKPTKPAASAVASVAARLKTFGLAAAKVQLTTNLEVPSNQTVVIDASDQKFMKQINRLTPTKIDDLKAWIGVPDEAFAGTPAVADRNRTVLPVHDAYTPELTASIRGVARDYIFGHSASVSAAQVPALNAWLKSVAGSINVVTFQDIHVAAGATLIVNPSITVLFARYITIDEGGVIKMRCNYAGINCAGIKGAGLRVLPPVPLRPVRPMPIR